MKAQLHCIARIHVVYLKKVDLLASLMNRKKELSFLYTFPSSIATAGFTQSIGSYRYPFNIT
ncbi:hypothetical protein Godav_019579 [Gossypium davidsonii]|uniref:Ycf15 n=1 Tax=Gossypium davidsonii TaxID=34287 RepID=A0A7J8R092_GOSDV|nr:hypothetical protein [Gossypium davidsonii]